MTWPVRSGSSKNKNFFLRGILTGTKWQCFGDKRTKSFEQCGSGTWISGEGQDWSADGPQSSPYPTASPGKAAPQGGVNILDSRKQASRFLQGSQPWTTPSDVWPSNTGLTVGCQRLPGWHQGQWRGGRYVEPGIKFWVSQCYACALPLYSYLWPLNYSDNSDNWGELEGGCRIQ